MSDTGGADRGSDASQAVPFGVRLAAAWTWRLLLIGFGVYVLIRIFGRIELVAFSFVLALFFTAVLHPLEKALRPMVVGGRPDELVREVARRG